jgi:hypothetical protein
VSFEIRNRAELVDALSVAAQVEHIVLVEYLYAAFSCRHTQDPAVSPKVQTTSWDIARELYLIAHQEMDHLGTVQQMLAALGAPPVPDAWAFPVHDPRVPFPCELTRLDADAVERFIQTEMPPPEPEALAAAPPDPIRFDVLGDLYRAIIDGLRLLGDEVFVGAEVTGTEPALLGFDQGDLRVATAADAIASLTTIVTQGEGASGAPGQPPGHFQRFQAMQAALTALSAAEQQLVSWPCVPNPVLRDGSPAGTTRLTHPAAVLVGDIANRAYRALWLLLGAAFTFDWSPEDDDATQNLRRTGQGNATLGARWVMATVLRPLGEILARLPAFDDDVDGSTAGMCFEQYGEFRVPTQPAARRTVILAELRSLAADLDTAAARADLAEAWAAPRLAAMAGDLRMIVERLRDRVGQPARRRFEPPSPGRWLSLDFDGWYQVRLATGGDPYNDPRGVSGWIFAYAGEPDLDRRLRLQPEGAFLRDGIDPGIAVGVQVRAATLDGQPRAEFVGARLDLLDGACFEGHNGVFAGDGDEPIVPFTLTVTGDGVRVRRSAADAYAAPYLDQAALGAAFGDSVAARALREGAGLPAQATPDNLIAHQREGAARLRVLITAATERGDTDAVLVLRHRLGQLTAAWWAFGAAVAWRIRLTGADPELQAPSGFGAAATDATWWVELLSTGFDSDACCALLRGVLHIPVDGGAGPPPWQIDLADATPPGGPAAMPTDRMGVRPGH